MEIGTKLKQARLASGLTQEQAVQRLFVSRQAGLTVPTQILRPSRHTKLTVSSRPQGSPKIVFRPLNCIGTPGPRLQPRFPFASGNTLRAHRFHDG